MHLLRQRALNQSDLAGGPCAPPLRRHYHGATMASATAFLEVPVSSCRSDSLGDACWWGG